MKNYLLELNEDVTGDHEIKSIHEKLNEDLEWNLNYDLVLASNLTNTLALQTSRRCHQGEIPFVLVR